MCLWPFVDRPAPAQLTDSLTQRSILLKRDFMEVLGGPIGLNRAAIRKWCFQQIASHDAYFDLIRDPLLSSHHSLLLTKVSLRPKLNHLLRCVSPTVIAPALRRFDRACMDLLSSKIAPLIRSSSLSSFASRQLSLPAAYGGLGFPNSSVSSLAAFVASSLLAIQDVQATLSVTPIDPSGSDVPATLLDIVHACDHLRQQGSTLDLPRSVASVCSDYAHGVPTHFQSIITGNLNSRAFENLMSDPSSSDADKARLIACCGDHASRWMHQDSLSSTHLSDGGVAAAVCHRLGLSSVPIPRSSCTCGKNLTATHLHTCTRNRRRGVLHRHDKVKLRLAYIARTAELDVEVEPSAWVGDRAQPDDEDATKVPDLIVKGLGQPVHVDVAILCPSATSHATRVVSKRGCSAVFRTRHSQKKSKYCDLAVREGACFRSFVLSSCGGFSRYATSFLRMLASHAAEHHPLFDYKTFYAWSVSQIAVALQEGNRAVDAKGVAIQH